MSLIVAANVVGWLLSQTAPDRLAFGEYLVGANSVPVTFPLCRLEPDPSASIEYKGKHFTVRPDGTIGQAVVADGFWGEFAAGYSAASKREGGAEWKTKIIIVANADLAEVQKSTGVRFRRGSIESAQMPEVLGGIARWAAMVCAATGGKVKPSIDLTIDETPERRLLTAENPADFDAAYLQSYIAPRLNAAPFESDDKTYRGPYHGAFVIHAGRTDPVKLTAVQSTPISAVSWYTKPALADGDRLALTLYGSWVRQSTWRAEQAGYKMQAWHESLESPFATIANPVVPDECWPKLLQFVPPQNAERQAIAATKSASKLPSNFWQLPVLTAPKSASADGVSITKTGNQSTAWVASGLANYFEDKVAAKYGFTVAGRAQVNVDTYVAFQSASAAISGDSGHYFFKADGTALAKPVNAATGTAPSAPLMERLTSEGMMKVEKAADVDKGPVYRLTERGFVRTGKAQLLESGSGFDLGDNKSVTLTFRQSAADAMAVQLDWSVGAPTIVVLDSITVPPLGVPREPADTLHFPVQALNQWQTVRVNLSASLAKNPGAKLTRIWVTPAPYYEYSERSQLQSATFEILPPTFSPVNGSENTPSTEATDSTTNRAAAIMNTVDQLENLVQAAEALSDPNRSIRATASYVLVKKPDAAAVTKLLDEVKSGFSWNSMLAIEALSQQSSPVVADALRRALEIGPLDHHRFAAALEVGRLADASFAGSLSLLYVSRDWQVRRAAVEALGKLNTREANIIMTTFAKDADAVVRLAFVTNAKVTDDLVARRVQYLAVNDVSESVRLAAALRLINSESAQLKKEGLASARDDSWWVREQILLSLDKPDEPDVRNAIRQGVADSDARVRAAAILALRSASKVDLRELGDVATEQDPRVIRALFELQRAGKITLPGSLREEPES